MQKKLYVLRLNYSLRPAFASKALESGMDIKVLSSILGHAKVLITLDRYAHALLNYQKYSIGKMSGFYGE